MILHPPIAAGAPLVGVLCDAALPASGQAPDPDGLRALALGLGLRAQGLRVCFLTPAGRDTELYGMEALAYRDPSHLRERLLARRPIRAVICVAGAAIAEIPPELGAARIADIYDPGAQLLSPERPDALLELVPHCDRIAVASARGAAMLEEALAAADYPASMLIDGPQASAVLTGPAPAIAAEGFRVLWYHAPWPWETAPHAALTQAALQLAQIPGARLDLIRAGAPSGRGRKLPPSLPVHGIQRGPWELEATVTLCRTAQLGVVPGSDATRDHSATPPVLLCWLGAGLPVAVPEDLEIAEAIADYDAGWIYAREDAGAVAALIAGAAEEPERLAEKRRGVAALWRDHFDARHRFENLARWCASPAPSSAPAQSRLGRMERSLAALERSFQDLWTRSEAWERARLSQSEELSRAVAHFGQTLGEELTRMWSALQAVEQRRAEAIDALWAKLGDDANFEALWRAVESAAREREEMRRSQLDRDSARSEIWKALSDKEQALWAALADQAEAIYADAVAPMRNQQAAAERKLAEARAQLVALEGAVRGLQEHPVYRVAALLRQARGRMRLGG